VNEGPQRLLIWGAGGHAVSVSATARAAGWVVEAFISDESALRELLGIPVRQDISTRSLSLETGVVIAIGDNSARQALVTRLRAIHPEVSFPAIVDPSATLAEGALVGAGTVVLQGGLIGAQATIGEFCIINTGSSLDHECVMHPFSSLAPGVKTGGRVTIGHRSAIGIGASIKHGVTIGDDAVIGGMSYVHRDIPPLSVCYGVPATIRRARQPDDPYLA